MLICCATALESGAHSGCPEQKPGAVVIDAAFRAESACPFASMVRLIVLSACDSGEPRDARATNYGQRVAQALHRCGFGIGHCFAVCCPSLVQSRWRKAI